MGWVQKAEAEVLRKQLSAWSRAPCTGQRHGLCQRGGFLVSLPIVLPVLPPSSFSGTQFPVLENKEVEIMTSKGPSPEAFLGPAFSLLKQTPQESLFLPRGGRKGQRMERKGPPISVMTAK